MGFVIIIDGPNFINDLQNNGKDCDYIMNTLSLHKIHGIVQEKITKKGLRGLPFIHTYFICGETGRIGDFQGEDRKNLIRKLQTETGVTVDEIKQGHKHEKEKQVDMNVFIRMLEMGPLARPYHDEWRHIVLMSKDTDFVPAIRMLSQMGVHTVVAGFDSSKSPYPVELKNESYLFLNMAEILEEMEKRLSKNQ